MAYVEPCCCERQLPRLLREKTIFFQTSGDVTIEHFMKSIGCMVENGAEMWLVAPDVDVKLLRVIRHWLSREWIVGLHLMTATDRLEMVRSEIAAAQQQPTEKIIYASDKMIVDGFLAFVGKEYAVVVQGAMLLEKNFSTRMYAGWYGSRDSEKIKGILEPFISKINIKRKIKKD